MMAEENISSKVKEYVGIAFSNHQINNKDLENAISEAIFNLLTDRLVIKELTIAITEEQEFTRNRFR